MLNNQCTEDYKKGFREAMQLIIDTAADAPEGSELIRIMHTANKSIIEADFLIRYPWH